MKIGTDLDDCIADFVPRFLKYHNKNCGTSHKFEDIFSFDLAQCLDVTQDEISNEIRSMQLSGEYRRLLPIRGAPSSIKHLHREGHRIYVVTNRICASDTIHWLDEYMIPYEKVILAKDKIPIFKELGVDVVIEDCFETAKNAAKAGIKTLLVSKPWNITDKLEDNMIRVYGWSDISKYVNNLNR